MLQARSFSYAEIAELSQARGAQFGNFLLNKLLGVRSKPG
jgi:hypothetical protein